MHAEEMVDAFHFRLAGVSPYLKYAIWRLLLLFQLLFIVLSLYLKANLIKIYGMHNFSVNFATLGKSRKFVLLHG